MSSDVSQYEDDFKIDFSLTPSYGDDDEDEMEADSFTEDSEVYYLQEDGDFVIVDAADLKDLVRKGK